jgi:hypothetical protein
MILSAPFDCVIMLPCYQWRGGGATKKTTMGNTDNCLFTTIVNSASMATPIGLTPKMADFCHTFNRLLVGRQCRRTLLWLYFNFYVVGGRLVVSRSLVGQSTIRVPGLWEVSLQKDKLLQFRSGQLRSNVQ